MALYDINLYHESFNWSISWNSHAWNSSRRLKIESDFTIRLNRSRLLFVLSLSLSLFQYRPPFTSYLIPHGQEKNRFRVRASSRPSYLYLHNSKKKKYQCCNPNNTVLQRQQEIWRYCYCHVSFAVDGFTSYATYTHVVTPYRSRQRRQPAPRVNY